MRVCAGGVLRPPLLFTLMYFSSFPIEVCFYGPVGCVTVSSYQGPSCRRLYPPRDHHPLRLPTTGPPPSQATHHGTTTLSSTHHGTTTVTVSRSEPPHSSTLLK